MEPEEYLSAREVIEMIDLANESDEVSFLDDDDLEGGPLY